MNCVFCGLNPFEYVDGVAVAVNCCEYGQMFYEDGWTVEEIERIKIEEKKVPQPSYDFADFGVNFIDPDIPF